MWATFVALEDITHHMSYDYVALVTCSSWHHNPNPYPTYLHYIIHVEDPIPTAYAFQDM